MIEMLTLVVVIATLLFTGWQAHQLTRQTRIQSEVALSQAAAGPLALLQGVLVRLIDEPELRPYIYGGRAVPASGPERERVLQLAELIADAVNHGCEVVEAMPASAYVTEGWADVGNYLLENSPALDHLVNQHPLWWGHLSRIRSARGGTVSPRS